MLVDADGWKLLSVVFSCGLSSYRLRTFRFCCRIFRISLYKSLFPSPHRNRQRTDYILVYFLFISGTKSFTQLIDSSFFYSHHVLHHYNKNKKNFLCILVVSFERSLVEWEVLTFE